MTDTVRKCAFATLLLVLLALIPCRARAVVVAPLPVYWDEPDFLSEFNYAHTEGFESLGPGTYVNPLSFGTGWYGFAASAPDGLRINGAGGAAGSMQSLSSVDPQAAVTLDMSSNPNARSLNSVGWYFAPLDAAGNPMTGTVRLTVNGWGLYTDETDPYIMPWFGPATWTFDVPFDQPGWGYIGALDWYGGPITSVMTQSLDGSSWAGVDAVTFGHTVMPEPAFYQLGTLLALGGLALIPLRRWRRR